MYKFCHSDPGEEVMMCQGIGRPLLFKHEAIFTFFGFHTHIMPTFKQKYDLELSHWFTHKNPLLFEDTQNQSFNNVFVY